MTSENGLPSIPAKRYFTIGEVAELCGVKPHVLRYWEQEFTQLRPMKRRGNRRYYQHHEVLMIRRIRDLLYDQGFTISGARNKLQEFAQAERLRRRHDDGADQEPVDPGHASDAEFWAQANGQSPVQPAVQPTVRLQPPAAAASARPLSPNASAASSAAEAQGLAESTDGPLQPAHPAEALRDCSAVDAYDPWVQAVKDLPAQSVEVLRRELLDIREILGPDA